VRARDRLLLEEAGCAGTDICFVIVFKKWGFTNAGEGDYLKLKEECVSFLFLALS
jgi:hypothetical protein